MSRDEDGLGPGLFPPPAVDPAGPHLEEGAQQLALIGDPTPIRIPAAQWSSWLSDDSIRTRYWAKVHRTASADCWFWWAAVSSTGHGSFRAASLPGRTRKGTVPAHLFGYQLAHGVIPRLGWGDDHPTVCHTCDNASCQQPDHLRLGTPGENRAEWIARRRNPQSPLADLRGAAGRSRAIATAIREGLTLGEPESDIAVRISEAAAAGRPLSLW